LGKKGFSAKWREGKKIFLLAFDKIQRQQKKKNNKNPKKTSVRETREGGKEGSFGARGFRKFLIRKTNIDQKGKNLEVD